MTGLDLAHLGAVSAARCQRWHPPGSEPWSLADWSNAMCGEAGEAANKIKKLRRLETGTAGEVQGLSDFDSRILARKAGLEIADTVIYAELLAQELERKYGGLDLSNLIVTKFNAVSEREGFPERLHLKWETEQ